MATDYTAQENATVIAHMYGYEPEQLASVVIITEADTPQGREMQVNKIMHYTEGEPGEVQRSCELLYILALLSFAADRMREELHKEIHG